MSLDPSRNAIPAHLLRLMSAADRARYSPGDVHAADAIGRSLAGMPVAAPRMPAAEPADFALVNPYREEARIQGEIIGWLRANGYEPCFPRPDRKSTLPLGWPDITLASRSGRAVALEVKTATGSTSLEQDERIAAMRRAGWLVEIVRSLDEAQRILGVIENQ